MPPLGPNYTTTVDLSEKNGELVVDSISGTSSNTTAVSFINNPLATVTAVSFLSGPPGTTDYNLLSNKPTLATVATTGSYNDLINKPPVGTGDMTKAVYDIDNDGVVDNAKALNGQLPAYYLNRSNHTGTQAATTITGLATVATSGSYNDLSNKPTIPTVTGTNTGDQTLSIAGSNLTISGTNGNTVTIPTGGSVSDATTAAKGIVQLAGDLAGTAASPTVPKLATKQQVVNTLFGNVAEAPRGTTLTKEGVIIQRGGGGWKNYGVEGPSIFFDPKIGKYRMLVTGYTGTSAAGEASIGCYVSTDLKTWNETGITNPIFGKSSTSGAPDEFGTTGPYCWFENGTYYLYYIGLTAAGYEAGTKTICLATSTDFATWTRRGAIISPQAGTWRDQAIWHPNIVKRGSTYYMFFNAQGTYEQIGYATSTNLLNWTVDDVNSPLITRQGSGWEGEMVGDPYVYRLGDTWWMAYFGVAPGYTAASEGLAYTTDANFPLGWTRYAGNPVLTPGTSGSYDDQFAHKPGIWITPNKYYRFYTALGSSAGRQVALASEARVSGGTSQWTDVSDGINYSGGNVSLGVKSFQATATPLKIDLGGTYSPTAGQGPKLVLYNNNDTDRIGFGVSPDQLDVMINSNFSYVIYAGATELYRVNTTQGTYKVPLGLPGSIGSIPGFHFDTPGQSDTFGSALGFGLDTGFNIVANTAGNFLKVTGPVQVAGKVTNVTDPTNPQDAATKAYVDSTTSSGTPDASTTTKGKVQLAGDLTGTAASPQIAAGVIVDADVNSSAAIALTKLAATTASRALVSNGSGFVSPSTVTSTELGYVSGVTSSIQTQLNAKGSGSVTSVSVVSANGLAGTVATNTTTPAITLSTTITGILKGNGTSISAATAGTDYYNPGGTDVAIADGGTGASTATAGFNNLAPSQSSNSGKFLTTDGTNASWATIPGGASVTKSVTQTSHGFVVKQPVRYNGTAWVGSSASSGSTADTIGVVTTVVDANNFIVTTHGYVSGLTGLTAGLDYYVPVTAGVFTSTEPSTVGQVSKPIFQAISTTEGFVINDRGISITTATPYSNRVVNITDGATITPDSSTTDIGRVTIAGSRTVAAPNGSPVDGQKLQLQIKQDATGGRTLTWNAAYRFGGGTAPTLSTGASKTDFIGFQWHATDNKWDCIAYEANH